jgi:diadenosine tetraphosphate (Ap4A) HIT family hydrolase
MSSKSTNPTCSKIESQAAGTCPLCQFNDDDRELVIYEDDHWIAYHSKETNILGYVVLKARRHLADLSQTDECAAAQYGKVLRRLTQAIREVTECARVYSFSLGESVPHYHLHMIPRTDAMPKAYRARGVMQYPLVPAADPALVAEACSRLKRALSRQNTCS